MDNELRQRTKTAALALLFGGLGAVVVAATVPDPGSTFVPLAGAGIVLYGLRLAIDAWTVPEWIWQVPLVTAAVIYLIPDRSRIYWTGGTLAALSVLVLFLAPIVDGKRDEPDADEG